MATNKPKTQKVADNDAATLGYLRKSDLSHKAEIQMLIALAEAYGIKMAYNEKDGEVTIERLEVLARQPEGESQPPKGARPDSTAVIHPNAENVKSTA